MHWKNSNFGIKNFLANGCHTPDEAYRILRQLYEERDVAIRNAKAVDLRQQAKAKRAELVLDDEEATEIDKLEAQADLVEIEAFAPQSEAVLVDAKRERDYIQSLIDEIQEYRVYGHLSDPDAFQEAQEDEWEAELIWRAENFLASQGSIPHDHLSTMRLHPKWESIIGPAVQRLSEQVQDRSLSLGMHKTPLLLKSE